MKRLFLFAAIACLALTPIWQPTRVAAQGTAAVQVAKSATVAIKGLSGAVPKSNDLKKYWAKIKSVFKTGTSPSVGSAGSTTELQKLTLDLKPPKEHCALPRDGAEEKQIYAVLDASIEADIQLVQYSIPCKELSAFWQGKTLSHWSLYTVSTAKLPTDATRERLVVQLTKTLPEFKLDDLGKLAKQKAPFEVSGLIESSADALYIVGLSQSVDNGKVGPLIASVLGMTLLADRVVGLQVATTFKDRKTIDNLLAEAKELVVKSIETHTVGASAAKK